MALQQRIGLAACHAVLVLLLSFAGSVAWAQPPTVPGGMPAGTEPAAGTVSRAQAAAIRRVVNAADAVRRMAAEPGMKALLAQAKGVFIVPTYGRAALGLGASGGAGVLVLRRADGTWTDPLFYNLGGLSIGAQAGAEGGPIAFVLLNDKAVSSFRQKNNFALSADAGLTVISFSKMAQGAVGGGDVVAWADTKGLFGNVATLAVRDIRFNTKATQAYYGRPATIQDVVEGTATNPQSEALKQALAAATGSGP
jgi:lipid-binding SYLF domain-containing protein